MKKNILFVDDDPNVLQGLKRMLYSMRNEWEMQFVESGAAALEEMDRHLFDVVITDMRMPHMNGAELLFAIREKYPETVRIILSGHSDLQLIMGSVQVAHQYISKPTAPDELKNKVNRSCALLERLRKASLRKVVSSMESIPTLPQVFYEITEELKKENASMKAIGDLISKDPAMTAKILQLVNSSFFGLSRTINSTAEAVKLLGLDTVKSLVLTVEIFSKFDRNKLKIFDIEGLWRHSVQTGTIAREIARHDDLDKKTIDNSCMAGLLHDIGKLVFMDNFMEEYQAAILLSIDENISLHDAETRIFDASHCEVGAYLLGIWGLPTEIVETVGFHHIPCQLPEKKNGTLSAVYIANILTQFENAEMEIPMMLERFDEDFLKEAGIHGNIESYNDICRNILTREGGGDD